MVRYPPSPGPRLPPAGRPKLPDPPRDPGGLKFPDPPEPCLQVDADEEDSDNTDIAKLSSSSPLPKWVRVESDFRVEGSSVTLQKGDECMLNYVLKDIERIHALDADKNEFWLPVQHLHMYEQLPIDPRLDNKTYANTTALAEAKPLPPVVRVTQGHDGGEFSNTVDVDDIIYISHVEMGKDITGKTQKVVIGKCGDQLMNLGEDLDYAEYTTMLSMDFLPMSEIIKFDFPQRVRVVDTEARVRDPKKERHLKLLSFEKEHHVICTQPGNKRVLSIPMTCPVRLTPVSGDWETCRKALPPIYPLLNYTWNVFDLGRPDLPDEYRQIPQPIPAVVHDWMLSYEGKNVSVDVADKYIKGLKQKLEDVKQKTQFHRSYLPPPEVSAVPLPPRVPGTGEQPPPRPPRPTPTPDQSSPNLQRSKSDSSGFRSDPARKLLEESEYDEIEDGYETPKGLKKKMDPLEEATIIELKSLLEKKEEVIRNAKIAEDHQKDKLELLSKENEDLQKKNNTYGSEIQRLQMELDHALARADMTDDGNVYDSLTPVPIPGGDSQIYNSPVDLRGMSAKSVQDVCDMLRELKLSQYIKAFENEQIDGNLLETLDDEILKTDIGMSGLHARKLTNAVKNRRI